MDKSCGQFKAVKITLQAGGGQESKVQFGVVKLKPIIYKGNVTRL